MTDSHIETLYLEAKSALKARDYEYAIELLKRVLVVDENYKDTSRLLEKAIRLRKLRWYNNPRLWGVLGLVIIFVLGITIAPKIGGLFASPTPTNTLNPTATRTAIPTSSPTVTPTHTSSPTPTATPLPSWVTDFAKPILDAIDGRTPNTQENFDLSIPNWLKETYVKKCIAVVNGEMIIDAPRNDACSVHWTMWYTDFVIEMDARMIPVEDANNPHDRWHFFFRGYQNFAFYYDGTVDPGGTFGFQPELEAYHVLIIVQEQDKALFINNQPIYYGNIPSGWKNGEASWFIGDPVAFDNIKIWDLNNLKNSP